MIFKKGPNPPVNPNGKFWSSGKVPYSNISYGQTINEDEYARDPKTGKPLRPEQKKLSLYEGLLDMFYTRPEDSSSSSLSEPNSFDNVLVEPYCGTGTGLVAGLLRNMKVLGIEKDPECVLAIQQRIKDKVGFRYQDEDFKYVSQAELKKFQEDENLMSFRKNLERFYTETKINSPFTDYANVFPKDVLAPKVVGDIIRLQLPQYTLFYRLVVDFFNEKQKRELENSRKVAVMMYNRDKEAPPSQRTSFGVQAATSGNQEGQLPRENAGTPVPAPVPAPAPAPAPAAAQATAPGPSPGPGAYQPPSLTSPPPPNFTVAPGGSAPPHLPSTAFAKGIPQPLVPFSTTVGKFSARGNVPNQRSISPQVSAEQQVGSTSTGTPRQATDHSGSIRQLEQQILKAPDGIPLEPVDLSNVPHESQEGYDIGDQGELPNFIFK